MKNIKKNLLILSSLALLASCGSNNNSQANSNSNSSTPEVAEEFTIRYMNNDGTDSVYLEETIKMKPSAAYINKAPADPVRDGYQFGGWQIKSDVTKADLVYGASPYEWHFGKNLSNVGQSVYASLSDSEKTTRELSSRYYLIKDYTDTHTLTLYPRWVEKTEIKTADDLQNMRDDLYGWYELSNDIDLTNYEFEAIGAYFSNYEYYSTSWWTYAFRGSLYGNNHTISNLSLNKASYNKNYKDNSKAVWNKDGNTCDGNAALFSATCNSTFKDLTLKGFNFDINFNGDFCYVASLAAFDMGSTLNNVSSNDFSIKVTTSDDKQVFRDNLFVAVAGLEAGSWSTTTNNCSATGKIELNTSTVKSHGGEIYLGGLYGENYSACKNTNTDVTLILNHNDTSTSSEDLELQVNAGGLGGALTGVTSIDTNEDETISDDEKCLIKSKIELNVNKPNGKSSINIGGIGGAKRYDLATNVKVESDISLKGTLDNANSSINVGSVSGRVDVFYLLQILGYTQENECGAKNVDNNVTFNGNKVNKYLGQIPEGLVEATFNDEKVKAIVNGSSAADKYQSTSNIKEIVELYGSYVSTASISPGIIVIRD